MIELKCMYFTRDIEMLASSNATSSTSAESIFMRGDVEILLQRAAFEIAMLQ